MLSQSCPSRQVLARIADKWTALVIYALSSGRMRYSELHRRIGGISQKMLTQTLRELEKDGLIARKIHPVVPPMVEYWLTPLGESLQEPLEAICAWAETHLPEMQAARSRSARRAPETKEPPPAAYRGRASAS